MVAIAAAVVLGLREGSDWPAPPAAETPAPPPTAAGAAVKPSFDIVRVTPRRRGDGGPCGAWVRDSHRGGGAGDRPCPGGPAWRLGVRSHPSLAPGTRELTLAARTPMAGRPRAITVRRSLIPDYGQAKVPVALLSTPMPRRSRRGNRHRGGPWARPGGRRIRRARRPPARRPGAAGADVPDLSRRQAGRRRPGGRARALGSEPEGHSAAGRSSGAARPDRAGRARHRARACPAAPPGDRGAGAGSRQVVVRPGETLWQLARHAYGSGTRYTLLYQANRAKIEDPGLIYPGQTFTVPAWRVSAEGGLPEARVLARSGEARITAPPQAALPCPSLTCSDLCWLRRIRPGGRSSWAASSRSCSASLLGAWLALARAAVHAVLPVFLPRPRARAARPGRARWSPRPTAR